jgi:osmotically-inducible protein OsmY
MVRARFHLFILLVATLFSLTMLTGCYTPAGRTAGEVIDDATITTMVKAKLFDSGSLNGLAISVKTFEGVVTLTGAVDTSQQKTQAERVTREVNEVRGVNNLIKLKQ